MSIEQDIKDLKEDMLDVKNTLAKVMEFLFTIEGATSPAYCIVETVLGPIEMRINQIKDGTPMDYQPSDEQRKVIAASLMDAAKVTLEIEKPLAPVIKKVDKKKPVAKKKAKVKK